MLPSLAPLSLNGRTCQPCRGAAIIGATKDTFEELRPDEDLLCVVCLMSLYGEGTHAAPKWTRRDPFKTAVFDSGKSSHGLGRVEWSVVVACGNEHVLHIGCAQKWFSDQRAAGKDPICPECRQPWDEDLSQAFKKYGAAEYDLIMSEPNEGGSGVAYYDFEYRRAERAIDAAERKGISAINERFSDSPELNATVSGHSGFANKARELLQMYRVTELDLGNIFPDDEGEELSRSAMKAAARNSIEAYIKTEVRMARVQEDEDAFGEEDLFRPVMQYYFSVCSALENLGPGNFSFRYDCVERDDGDFDRTKHRGLYLRYPPDLQNPHDPDHVTEQGFFDMYPYFVENPYEVENTYHVSFLQHRLRKKLEEYTNMYTNITENILTERRDPGSVSLARRMVQGTAEKFFEAIGIMERNASEAIAYMRDIKQSTTDSELLCVILDGVVDSIVKFEEALRGIVELVGSYKAPAGERLMRRVRGASLLMQNSKPFFEVARSSMQRMQLGFHSGLRSVAKDCRQGVRDEVMEALKNTAPQSRINEWDDSSDSDSGGDRGARQRTA